MEIEKDTDLLQKQENIQNHNNQSKATQIEAQKEQIKQKFQKILTILQTGCDKQRCRNTFCAKNPNSDFNLETDTKTKLSEIALKLVQNHSIQLCCDEPAFPNGINTMLFEQSVNSCKMENNYNQILLQLRSVFSSIDSINLSFYSNNNVMKLPDEYNHYVDFKAIQEFFVVVERIEDNQISKQIFELIYKEIETLFVKLDKIDLTLIFRESQDLRILLIIFAIPQIFEIQNINLLIHVLNIFNQIPQKLQSDYMKPWFSQFSKTELESLLENMQNLLTLKIMTYDKQDVQQEFNYRVCNLAKFMEFLYQTNFIEQKVSYDRFTNASLCHEINPHVEYKIWVKNKNVAQGKEKQFTFCDFPFLFDVAMKHMILEAESKKEMETASLHSQFVLSLSRNQTNQQVQLQALQQQPHFELKVRRDNIIDDTLSQILKKDLFLAFKKKLKVKFVGEDGADLGGVKKEYFQLITKQLFSLDYGMFVSRRNERMLWFNCDSFECNLNFELVGMLLGLAIYNTIYLDLWFPQIVYKKILNEQLILRDLDELDPELSKNLQNILEYEGDVESDLNLTFQIQYSNSFDQNHVHFVLLKEKGDQINVTNENCKEFVNLYFEWYVNKSIQEQFAAFNKGFYKVVRGEAIKFLNSNELHTLICGSEQLNFEDLQKGTTDFWEIIHLFTIEEKKKFLMFTTGSDRSPIRGLQYINLIISRRGPDQEELPISHTCFNHLEIPEYSSKQKLEIKLKLAITYSEGFGMV